MTLYGICRELNKCVCGLCARIVYGSNKTMAERGRPEPNPGCDKCGAQRLRKNHKCPAENKNAGKSRSEIMRESWVRRRAAAQAPATTPHEDEYSDYYELDCGCYIFMGRRIKWCYKDHNPEKTPNPPQ